MRARPWSATSSSTRDSPSRYLADVSRRHRWIRGDWQIAPWLLPPGARAVRAASCDNPLSALSRWKIFDNLRRSLVPPALALGAGRVGWSMLGPPWLWTLVVAGDRLSCPPLLRSADGARAQAGGPAAGRAPAAQRRTRSAEHLAQTGLDARLPAVRGLLEPRCDHAHGRAAESDAHRACWNGRPSSDAARNSRADRLVDVVRSDVDRARARGRARDRRSAFCEAGGTGRCGALARSCGSFRRCSPGGSAGREPRRRAELSSRADGLPARPGAPRPGASSRPSSGPKTTGCRPTTSRSTPSP